MGKTETEETNHMQTQDNYTQVWEERAQWVMMNFMEQSVSKQCTNHKGKKQQPKHHQQQQETKATRVWETRVRVAEMALLDFLIPFLQRAEKKLSPLDMKPYSKDKVSNRGLNKEVKVQ